MIGRDVIAHWLDTMTAEGWIPREQILGAEAEARLPVNLVAQVPSLRVCLASSSSSIRLSTMLHRVPAEFMVQNPLHANPPTLFLPLVNLTEWVRQHVANMDMPRGSQQWSAGEFLTAGCMDALLRVSCRCFGACICFLLASNPIQLLVQCTALHSVSEAA